ncbi:MAG: L-lactate dehydrogenase [Oscillospiraceae bacterium]|nr:L-lactate dehydrogenase [Oscillospiraceae bacterium]
MKKISIIGAGAVGSNIAYSLVIKNLAKNIALIDINNKLVQAEVLDIKHGISCFGDVNIKVGTYQDDIKDSDIIIVTAGRSRRPGETRLDMIVENLKISKIIAENIKKYYNNNKIIVVSNPVDIITYQISKILDINKNLIFGTGCSLDTSRFIFSIADYISCPISDVSGLVIGEHGDSQVIVWSQTKIKNILIDDYCKSNNILFDQEIKSKIENDVIKMGANIISGKNKTHFGISTCVCHLVDIILNNKKQIISLSSCLDGEFGLCGVSLSLPFVLGQDGVEKLEESICKNLTLEEKSKLIKSGNNLKEFLDKYII